MKIINSLEEMKALIKGLKAKGKSIGFVPTMGFLHEGHLSLMKRARVENQVVVVSIFVNPTQFGPGEDFEAYPRNPEGDIALMEGASVDFAFMPSQEELYPEGFVTYVEVSGDITKQLCGKSRPGHFKGVTTIVAKLFHLIQPTRAYFGQKDAQQVAVIQRMVDDLDFNVELVACPIIRETDGLAMSSRNVYLDPNARHEALALSQGLKMAERAICEGEKDAQVILDLITKRLSQAQGAKIDYILVVDQRNLLPIQDLKGKILIAAAVYFGKTRLIDNIPMEVSHACQYV